jgi:hypothetical protein
LLPLLTLISFDSKKASCLRFAFECKFYRDEKLKHLLAILFVLFTPLSIQASPLIKGVVFIGIELHDSPSDDSKVLGSLEADSPIEVKIRKGRWSKVESETGATGWIHTMFIRVLSITKQDNGQKTMDIINNKHQSRPTPLVAAAGIRGLDEESLKVAELDLKQLALLEGYSAKKSKVDSFAKSGKLKSKALPFDGEPKTPVNVSAVEK